MAYRLIISLFIVFYSSASFALVPTQSVLRFSYEGITTTGTFEEACSSMYDQIRAAFPSDVWQVRSELGETWSMWGNNGCKVVSPDSYTQWLSLSPNYVLQCPSNSSPSGSQCTCNEGYEEKNGNSCEKPKEPDACENLAQSCTDLKGSKLPRFEVYYSGNIPSFACSNPPIGGCSQGCSLELTGIGVGYKTQDGRNIYSSPATFTADVCTPVDVGSDGDQPDKDKKCKPGEYPGTVNGTKVCLPAQSKESEHETSVKENSDGTKTESSTTTTCANGICTSTTTTINKDASGNVTGSSTNSTTISESEFCSKNPGNKLCAGSGSGKGDGEEGDGNGSFGGSCSAGFTCEGDAALCAIAKEQHRINCELFAPAPNNAIPTDGSADELKANADVITIQSLDSTGLGWSRSCPADKEFSLGFVSGTMTIPYSKLCGVLGAFANILLAITAIGLLHWLVGGKKD